MQPYLVLVVRYPSPALVHVLCVPSSYFYCPTRLESGFITTMVSFVNDTNLKLNNSPVLYLGDFGQTVTSRVNFFFLEVGWGVHVLSHCGYEEAPL